jgi:RHS repeat-associated protein
VVNGISNVWAVAGGQYHTVAADTSGTVWTWGYNNYGQLGNGTTSTNYYRPLAISGVDNVVGVAAGQYHTLALRSDGTVWAWGYNSYGQLGNGTSTNYYSPLAISGVGNVVGVAAGAYHTVALCSNGTVWAWGYNNSGQLGDGTMVSQPAPERLGAISNVVAIAAGQYHTVALCADRTVWTCGYNGYGQLGRSGNQAVPGQVNGLSNVVAIAAGQYHTLAVTAAGQVYSWGWNYYGQLGLGNNDQQNTPRLVGTLSGTRWVSAGNNHSLAVESDGTIWTWGANGYGQLGQCTAQNLKTPGKVGLSVSSPAPMMAIVSDDTTVCNGGTATIQAELLAGSSPWTLVWSDGIVQSNVTSSPAMHTVSPTSTTTYAVAAVHDSQCTVGTSSGSATVTVNELPTMFNVTGGGSFSCGGSGVLVGLSNSQFNVNYQLRLNGSDTNAPVAGTGEAISFGNQTVAGAYTVLASNVTTGCSATMAGSATVTVNPPTVFSVTGGGSYCSGGSGVPVGLSNSQFNVNYQLRLNGSDKGAPVAGTGAAISFGNQIVAGAYTVMATGTSCSAMMAGSATVIVNTLPTAKVSGDATICAGQSATIQAELTGTSPWTVTWSDGTNQIAASSPAVRSVRPTSTTIYTVTNVSDSICSSGTSSGSATIEVHQVATSDDPAALHFDGIQNYAASTIGPNSETYPDTIEIVFRSAPSAAASTGMFLCGQVAEWSSSKSNGWASCIINSNTGGSYMRWCGYSNNVGGCNSYQNMLTNVFDGNWHHLSITTTNSGRRFYHCDGRHFYNTSAVKGYTFSNDTSIFLGGSAGHFHSGSSATNFSGDIAGFRMSNTNRWTGTNTFTAPLCLSKDTNTAVLYTFTNNTGTVVSDMSGHGYDLTLGSPAPVWTYGPCAVPLTAKVRGDAGICAGQSATIHADLTGTGPLTVTWSDGFTQTNITNFTATYTVSPTSTTTYTVAVYDSQCTLGTSSDSATITIINSAPEVTTEPSDQTVCAGRPVSFTAAASGSPATTMQWQVSTNGGVAFSNWVGKTNTTLAFTASALDNSNQYRAVFNNCWGSAVSSTGALTVISSNLIAWWPFDEGTGTVARDSSCSGHDGTLIWGPTWVTGVLSNALSFQKGGYGYVLVTSEVSAVTGTFTVASWVLPILDDWGNHHVVLQSDNEIYKSAFRYELNNMCTRLYVYIGNGSTPVASPAVDFPYSCATGPWYHIACVVTPTNYTIYVNGAVVGSGSYAATNPLLVDVNHPISIGADIAHTGEYTFDGSIDDVRVYNLALAASEVAALYNVDTIGDGIPNWWRARYFGSGSTTNNSSCASCDPDGDGMVNSNEYLVGTDPLVGPLIITAPAVVLCNSANHTSSVDDIGPGVVYSWTVTTNATIIAGQGTRAITWNAGATGPITLRVAATNTNSCRVASGLNLVQVLCSNDSDGDGLTDWDEINVYHTDPHNPDTDGDGLTDAEEVYVYGTDPLNPDTDCDGVSDGDEVRNGTDPLVNPTGACCRTYTADRDFDEGELVGVNHDAPNHDQLQMNAPLMISSNCWVACSARGTIVRIDVNATNGSAAVMGEYYTSPEYYSGYSDGNPSRTTVDKLGNVWVANRYDILNGHGSVARVGIVIGGARVNANGVTNAAGQYLKGPFEYCTCVDRHGATTNDPPDGLIKTSRGLGDILPWPDASENTSTGRVSSAEDECIINLTEVAASGTRTVAIDVNNDVWVGGTGNRVHEKISGITGEPIPGTLFNTNYMYDCGGYGGLIDQHGVLWSSRPLLRFEPNPNPPPDDSDPGEGVCIGDDNYGIGMDPNTGHIWITSGEISTNWGVLELDSDGNVLSAHHELDGYGICVDTNSHVWVAGDSYVAHYAPNPTNSALPHVFVGSIHQSTVGGSTISFVAAHGVAVDPNGKIWAPDINRDTAWRIDPSLGPLMLNGVANPSGYPVGAVDMAVDLDGTNSYSAGPYNYSDMTGSVSKQLPATWTVIHDSGAGGTPWGEVSWTASTSSNSAVTVKVRTAGTIGNLASNSYVTVTNGIAFSNVPDGRYIQVQVTLTSNGGISPILYDLTVCPASGLDQPPVANCRNVQTNTTPDSSYATVPPTAVYAGTNDLIANSLTLALLPGTVFPVGVSPATLTITDPRGAGSSCDAIITVLDPWPPSIACPPSLSIPADPGSNSVSSAALGWPIVTDNQGILSVVNNAPASLAVGTHSITWTATDLSGNANSCAQTVVVYINQPSAVFCPPSVTTNTDPGLPYAGNVSLGTPTVTGAVSTNNDAPAHFPIGSTVVTWTATDAGGHTNTCQQTVTVLDLEPPTITAPAGVSTNSSPSQSYASNVNLGAPTATNDNSGIVIVRNDAPNQFPIGTTMVIWTATDGSGNSATATQYVTVADGELPSLSCPTNIIAFTGAPISMFTNVPPSPSPILGANLVSSGGYSNTYCGPYYGSGTNLTYNWSITGNGTILGSTTSSNITVRSENAGTYTLSLTYTNTAIKFGGTGQEVVQVGTNNISGVFGGVLLSRGGDITVEILQNSAGWLNKLWVFSGPPYTNFLFIGNNSDTHKVVNVGSYPKGAEVAFGIVVYGPAHTNTWLMGPGSRNIDNTIHNIVTNLCDGVADVGFEDNTFLYGSDWDYNDTIFRFSPVDVIAVPTNICSTCGTNVVLGWPSDSDNYGIQSLTNDAPTQFYIGDTPVHWTVVDVSGHTNNCTQTVHISPAPPMFLCPPTVIVTTNTVSSTATNVALGTPILGAICEPYTITNNAPSAFPLGTNTVIWTATGASSNQVQCTQQVIVLSYTTSPTWVVLVQPANHQQFALGDSISLVAKATNSANVVFYDNGVTKVGMGTLSSGYYISTWTNAAAGTHSLTAGAFNNGNTNWSTAAVIRVGPGPIVNLTAPNQGARFGAGTNITLTADASEQGGTITNVEFFANNVKVGEDTNSSHSVTWFNVAARTYSLVAKAWDSVGASAASPPITITVNAAPSVAMVAPTNNTVAPAGTVLTLLAATSDSDGSVTNVVFTTNSVVFGAVSSAPYSLSWTVPSNVASTTLRAIAFDNLGSSSTSTPVIVTGNQPPTVSISTPTNNAAFAAGQPIVITATADDPDGSIARVELRNGTIVIGILTNQPYAMTWYSAPVGTNALAASAIDNLGASAISTPAVNVIVTNLSLGIAEPVVAITAPTSNPTIVAPGADVTIAATATPAAGSITNISVYANNSLWGQAASASCNFTRSNLVAGSYTLVAKATDSSGTTGSSLPVSLIVHAPPQVTLLAPAGNSIVQVGRPVALLAAAGDMDGAVTNVTFYRGSTPIGSDSSSPYTATWNATGACTTGLLYAVAFDNRGATAISATASVFVAAPPSVTLTSPTKQLFQFGEPIPLAATASNACGTAITKVEFYQGDNLFLTDVQPPYGFTWQHAAPNTYTVFARATDSAGGTSNSAPITFRVNAPPTVDITSPAFGSILLPQSNVTITATFSDADGTVQSVKLSCDANTLYSATPATANGTVSITTNFGSGSYNFSAVATDNDGAVMTSGVVNVMFDALPTITLTSPTNGVVYNQGQPIQITAEANDDALRKIVIVANNNLLVLTNVASTNATVNFVWTNAVPAAYNLQARVTDQANHRASSSIISIKVNSTNDVTPPIAVVTARDGNGLLIANGQSVSNIITVTVSATDDQAVSQVMLGLDQYLIAQKLQTNLLVYALNTAALTNGPHTLLGAAMDASGNLSSNASLPFIVANPINTNPPTVIIYFPTNNTVIPFAPVNVEIAAVAQDEDGINRVEFSTNGAPYQTVFNPPYSVIWSNLNAGSYAVSAKAWDNSNPTDSSIDSVNFVVGTPTLTLTPTNSCVGLSNTTFMATATLHDATGAPVVGSNVTFTVTGAHTGTVTSATGSGGVATYTYTGTNAGPDRIQATSSLNGQTLQSATIIKDWATQIQCSNVVPASLAETDGYSIGCQCASPARYADFYSFSGTNNQIVTFTMGSTNFTAFMFIMNTNCAQYAVTNGALNATNTQIRFTLPATGAYILEATSAEIFQTGAYTLQMVCGAASAPRIAVLVSGTNVANYGTINFGSTTTGTAVSRTLVITNEGSASLVITGAESSEGYTVNLSPPATITAGSSASYTLTFSNSNPGIYFGYLTLDNNDTDRDPFVLNLSAIANLPGQAPAVTIIAPTNGTRFVAPASFEISASAAASNATVTRVDFYASTALGSVKIGSKISGVGGIYSIGWSQTVPGNYALQAVAFDNFGRATVSAPVPVEVYPSAQNRPPVAQPDTLSVNANSVTNYLDVLANDSDPDGDPLTIVSVSNPGLGTAAIINGGTALSYTPPSFVHGSDGFHYTISDGKGGMSTASVNVAIEATPIPQIIITGPAPTDGTGTLYAGAYTNVTLSFETPTQSIVRVEYYMGSRLVGVVTSPPFTTFNWFVHLDDQCTCGLQAAAIDKYGQQGISQIVHYNIVPPTNASTVFAQVDSPAPVTSLIAVQTPIVSDGILVVTGSVYQINGASTNATEYKVLIETPEGTVLRDSGWFTNLVNHGVINTNDLTTLQNDRYQLELLARNDYATTSAIVPFTLNSQLKIGQFSFSQQDLVIPVSGIPLSVIRTYNSLSALSSPISLQSSDFGPGWTYAINDMDVKFDEDREETDSLEGMFSMRVGGSRDVTLTLPDGRRVTFQFNLTPCGFGTYCAIWTPPPGVHATLKPTVDNRLITLPMLPPYWSAAGPYTPWENYDFPGFILTAADGTQYRIEREPLDWHSVILDEGDYFFVDAYDTAHLSSITDRNNNRIEMVTSSSAGVPPVIQQIDHYNPANVLTKSVLFHRDGQNRIDAIYDPNSSAGVPPSVVYVYDSIGNLSKVYKLVSATGGTGVPACDLCPASAKYETTEYLYENSRFPHFITSIKDPRGVTPLRNLYDDSGRLIGVIDAFGKTNSFVHDLANRTETVTDRMGNQTIHVYDDRGNVTSSTDASGTINRSYDANNNLLSESDQLGHTTYYGYDGNGNRTNVTDALNHINSFTYDGNGNMLTHTDPLGHTTQNIYDSAGNLTVTIDASGAASSHAYENGKLKYTYNAKGERTASFGYDAAGNMTNTTDAAGFSRGFSYDANGNQTNSSYTWVNPIGGATVPVVTSTLYDSAGRVTASMDADSNWTYTVYNEIGKVASTTNKLGLATSFTYDARGNLIQTIYPDSTVTRTVYDDNGRAVVSTSRAAFTNTVPDSMTFARATRTDYNAVGRATNTVRLTNAEITINNNAGVVSAVLSGAGSALSTSSTEYYDNGWVKSRTGPDNQKTSYEYYDDGQLKAVTDPLSKRTEYEYDGAGRRQLVRDALQHVTRFGYDADGRQVTTIFHDTTFTSNIFNNVGQKVGETDQAGLTTDYDYDESGRLTGVKKPQVYDAEGGTNAQPTWQYVYDTYGRLFVTVDPKGRTTTNGYDAVGRQILRILPMRQTETNQYDNLGRLWKKYDFKGQKAEFLYDSFGRVATQQFYDASSQLAKCVCIKYDELGRQKRIVELQGTGLSNPGCDVFAAIRSTGAPGMLALLLPMVGLVSFPWRNLRSLVGAVFLPRFRSSSRRRYIRALRVIRGYYPLPSWIRLISLILIPVLFCTLMNPGFEAFATPCTCASNGNDDVRVTEFTYDADGHVTQICSPEGAINYEYDSATGRHTRTYTSNNDAEYQYDQLGRLWKVIVHQRNGVSVSETNTYTYTDVGSRDSITLPNGTKSTYEYDNLNRLKKLENRNASNLLLSSFDYLLHATGRRTNATEVILQSDDSSYVTNNIGWTYDGMYRLTQETRGAITDIYGYDLVGNRKTKTMGAASIQYYYNANDQLTNEVSSASGATSYGYDANGSLISKSGSGGSYAYTYDVQNRMNSVTVDSVTTSYLYNYTGIRVRATTGGVPKYFLTDPNNHTGYAQVLEELSTVSGAPSMSYVIGDDVLAQASGSSASYLLYDGHGSTRQLASGASHISNQYNYDAYGQTLGMQYTPQNPPATTLLYSGEQFDVDAQQYYLRARYYDPSNGRFNQPDTYAGNNSDPQSLHKYLYAGCDPVNGIDPSGKQFTLGELLIGVAIIGIIVSVSWALNQWGKPNALLIDARDSAPDIYDVNWSIVTLSYGLANVDITVAHTDPEMSEARADKKKHYRMVTIQGTLVAGDAGDEAAEAHVYGSHNLIGIFGMPLAEIKWNPLTIDDVIARRQADTGGVPPTVVEKRRFYTNVMMHELGHVHFLNHTSVAADNVMTRSYTDAAGQIRGSLFNGYLLYTPEMLGEIGSCYR